MAEQLSARLLAAASLVRPGYTAADIGCDHGKLAVYLVKAGRCPIVIAADLRAGPLAAAKALVEKEGLSGQIDCRLGDGLTVLCPGEAQDFVLAGMGGETIGAILAAAPWVKDPALSFVLVPATGHSRLRRFLYEQGFQLNAEQPLFENGHWYTVMRAAYAGTPKTPDDVFCAAGLVAGQKGESAAGYLGWVRAKLEKQWRGKRRSAHCEELTGLEELIGQVEREEQRCRE